MRHDFFSTEVTNLFPGTGAPGRFGQEDNFYSPRAGIILKPTADVSLYASYSTTYLPASGDQFGSVTTATQKLEPEKYGNYEVDLKWDVTESLAFTAAAYEVDRTNVRFAQPNGSFPADRKIGGPGHRSYAYGLCHRQVAGRGGIRTSDGRADERYFSRPRCGNAPAVAAERHVLIVESLPAYARRNNSEYGLCPTLLHFHQRAPAIKDVMRR